ncbi:MAG: AAA family ATPase [Lachnospiraceae bacterium]|nr:AAA family ATPase [Lachnospiraceae bacterium]
MNEMRIPIGRSGFADIRRNGYYYVDKSGFIRELLRTAGRQVTLITRPRRFGKTLGMSMLSEFFDIRKESSGLFAGLSITKEKNLCKDWMNQYPTLFLSLKSVDGLNFGKAYEKLAAVIADLYKEHIYLRESGQIDSFSRELYDCVAAQKATQGIRKAILQIDSQMYGKEFREDYSQVLCYGSSFYKKRCLVRLKEDSEENIDF